MQISISGHHAIRIMLDLALHSDETPVFRHTISERQGISPDYIAQICGRLNKAGLLKSTMGPEGGYGLSRAASEIKVGEIIHAIEGPPPTTYCIAPGKKISCIQPESCTTRRFLMQLSQVVESYLNSVTLQDLCDQSEQLEHIVSFQFTPHPFEENLNTPLNGLGNTEVSQS
jgi:Rrf2 family protein